MAGQDEGLRAIDRDDDDIDIDDEAEDSDDAEEEDTSADMDGDTGSQDTDHSDNEHGDNSDNERAESDQEYVARHYKKLPVATPSLQHALAQELYYRILPHDPSMPSMMAATLDCGMVAEEAEATAGAGPFHCLPPVPAAAPAASRHQPVEQPRRSARLGAGKDQSPECPPASPPFPPACPYSLAPCNLLTLLSQREAHDGLRPSFSAAQRRNVSCRYLPQHECQVVERGDEHGGGQYGMAYIGRHSPDGSMFVAGFQERRIRIYDTARDHQLRKDVVAPYLRWTITAAAVSPDHRHLLYSTIAPVVYMVDIAPQHGPLQSISNITDVHDTMHFDNSHLDLDNPHRMGRHAGDFGIFSLAWSPCNGEVLAGSNDNALYLYDVEEQRVRVRVVGHRDDVNAVCYLDSSGNMMASGSDDQLVKVWDRRTLGAGFSGGQPVGVLVGHRHGITHLDAKGDGRYLISNSKDQTIRLWDVRSMKTPSQAHALPRVRQLYEDWDYRYNRAYPGRQYCITHPHDCSIRTYRGHQVARTLIRSYWSPEHTTAQRYIYTGSADGCIYIYDVVTGEVVRKLRYHTSIVRDCSWHPYEAELISVSWDGSVVRWGNQKEHEGGLPGSRPQQAPEGGYNYYRARSRWF